MKQLIASVLFFSILCGCNKSDNQTDEQKSYKFDNIARLFWHDNGRFSIFVPNENNELEIHTFIPKCCGKAQLKIATDAKNNETTMANVISDEPRKHNTVTTYLYDKLEIHIHEAKQIKGANWNHGDDESGASHIIE